MGHSLGFRGILLLVGMGLRVDFDLIDTLLEERLNLGL